MISFLKHDEFPFFLFLKLQFSPPFLDVGTTLVGAETTKILTLMNTSDCDLHYRVDSIRSSGECRSTLCHVLFHCPH